MKKGQKKRATEAEFITKVLPVGFQPMLRQTLLEKGLETSGSESAGNTLQNRSLH